MNGASVGICVLEPCLIHAWVLTIVFQFWHVCGRTYLQSSLDWEMKTLMTYKRHDYSAINDNFPGGILPTICCRPVVGPHMSIDTIAEVRQLMLGSERKNAS